MVLLETDTFPAPAPMAPPRPSAGAPPNPNSWARPMFVPRRAWLPLGLPSGLKRAEYLIARKGVGGEGKGRLRLILHTAAPAAAVAEQTAACNTLGHVNAEHVVRQRQVAGVEDAGPIGC